MKGSEHTHSTPKLATPERVLATPSIQFLIAAVRRGKNKILPLYPPIPTDLSSTVAAARFRRGVTMETQY